MQYHELKKILQSIQPDRHIINHRVGSEENVKIKIILPLLQFLGYDVVKDMDFEFKGADIVIVDKNNVPVLIVETKSWGQPIQNYLPQCLEYTLKLKMPLILISSGQQTSLYSSLINPHSLRKTKPLLDFRFNELNGKKSKNILENLKKLISKDSFLSGSKELTKKVTEQLLPPNSLENVMKRFVSKSKKFKPTAKSFTTNEDNFKKIAKKHPTKIFKSLCFGVDEFKKILPINRNLRMRYRSVEIGLEYLLDSEPRSKVLGLVGIYPNRAGVAFGWDHWKKLNITKNTLKKMEEFNKPIKDKDDIKRLVILLKKAIGEIKK